MDFLTHLGMGFGVAFTPFNLLMAVAGVMVGILIGALPGVGPPSGVAMLLLRSLREQNPGESWFPRGEGLRHMLVVLGVTVLFVVLLNVLGMVIGTALYLAILVRYLGRHRWWVTAAIACGAAGFNWLVFVHWLRVPFPEGKLWIF